MAMQGWVKMNTAFLGKRDQFFKRKGKAGQGEEREDKAGHRVTGNRRKEQSETIQVGKGWKGKKYEQKGQVTGSKNGAGLYKERTAWSGTVRQREARNGGAEREGGN